MLPITSYAEGQYLIGRYPGRCCPPTLDQQAFPALRHPQIPRPVLYPRQARR